MSILTNIDIEEIMKGLRVPLVGVFLKDALPKTPRDNGFIVMNMSDVGEVGTHWVGLALIGDTAMYYDPFGIAPPPEVVRFFDKYITQPKYKTSTTPIAVGQWWRGHTICLQGGVIVSAP
jgi:hypothetical protein